VSAVGHYLEQEGIPSASISLLREHTEVIKPPRALWVPFVLGRPLGAPNDPVFQRSVLRALLALFDEPAGPVLRDFPFDAPGPAPDAEGEGEDACPVNFSRIEPDGDGQHALANALAREIDQLRPWHDITIRRRGGTAAALSGLLPEEAGRFIASFLGAQAPANYLSGQPMGQALKFACDDLRSYYEDAAAAQPGEMSAGATQRWFFGQTVAGDVLRKVQLLGAQSSDASVKLIADTAMVPRAVLMGESGTHGQTGGRGRSDAEDR